MKFYFARGDTPPVHQSTPLQAQRILLYRTNIDCCRNGPMQLSRVAENGVSDQSNFPISTTVSAVVLDLEPGALRELHWHPTADEWHYIIEGNVSVSMFGSHGRYATEQLEKGDVGYIPQGYGHSIENIGNTKSRLLIVSIREPMPRLICRNGWQANRGRARD